VGLRAGMDVVKKRKKSLYCFCQKSNSGHLAHSLLTELPWLL